jgi:hypothetical protein
MDATAVSSKPKYRCGYRVKFCFCLQQNLAGFCVHSFLLQSRRRGSNLKNSWQQRSAQLAVVSRRWVSDINCSLKCVVWSEILEIPSVLAAPKVRTESQDQKDEKYKDNWKP